MMKQFFLIGEFVAVTLFHCTVFTCKAWDQILTLQLCKCRYQPLDVWETAVMERFDPCALIVLLDSEIGIQADRDIKDCFCYLMAKTKWGYGKLPRISI